MPTRVVRGSRIGKQGRIRTGCSAVIFDEARQKVLLTRRTDNGMWCLPGGGVDPGEDVSETCLREIWEETGLRARVVRLIGVYSSPDWLVEYDDGNRAQIVALSFEAQPESGALTINNEVSEFGYFDLQQIEGMELMLNHHQRIVDAFTGQVAAYVR